MTNPPDTQTILAALTQAVTNELDRKRRLGHYYVIWENGRAIAIGDDAPEDLKAPTK
jgi:recombinational DNA repair protein RecT